MLRPPPPGGRILFMRGLNARRSEQLFTRAVTLDDHIVVGTPRGVESAQAFFGSMP
jgi:hypothetical protein